MCRRGKNNTITGKTPKQAHHLAAQPAKERGRPAKEPHRLPFLLPLQKGLRLRSKTPSSLPIPERGRNGSEKVIALAGNPNVGKSTLFNALTGMRQHTGNWPGKTVASARGRYHFHGQDYELVDLPGSYSLFAHSAEEEVTRDFLCFGQADGVLIVCDGCAMERNLNLVLQVLEIQPRAVVLVNLLDQVRQKGITLDLDLLAKKLGTEVLGISAGRGEGMEAVKQEVQELTGQPIGPAETIAVLYPPYIEAGIDRLGALLAPLCRGRLSCRWLAVRMLADDRQAVAAASAYLGKDLSADTGCRSVLAAFNQQMRRHGVTAEQLRDDIVQAIMARAESISAAVCGQQAAPQAERGQKLDRVLLGRWTAFPVMLGFLLLVFWLTMVGANYPSQWLNRLLFSAEQPLYRLLTELGVPAAVGEMLVYGMYRVLAWVVSVMLPPMAIFFPLFTLLEDWGYLPRIAFNLDRCFQKCRACGKQALTMCMGFGCNAVGVSGCRIIDSPRERLIAMLTNVFVPCNGRFPAMIALAAMFFVGSDASGLWGSLGCALAVCAVILFGIGMTLLLSRLLSATLLKGLPSSFVLELPPYRKPQIGKVLLRSVLDRTLFVLGRAVSVAAPAGVVIWLLANVQVEGLSLLRWCTDFLDPFAAWLGLDGVILFAFILGLPANEIVMPLIIMSYLAQGALVEMDQLTALKALLVDHGWTWMTAVSTLLFSLMHWPCATTCLTIKKESGSLKWTVLAFLLPTLTGMLVCFLFHCLCLLFGG